MASPFSCRTLAPWDEDRWGFVNSAGLRLWLARVCGCDVSWTELSEVRTWLKGAREGDVAYLDAAFRVVPLEGGEIEIRCNRIVV